MVREVDLVSYLPSFLASYKETNTALTAENPEFVLVWKAADQVLKNEFIATADEYGIARFEKLLNIFPSAEDTLESRRVRVMSRWFLALPYTWRMFLQKLTALCGEHNFSVTKQFDFYRIALDVHLELFGQVEELERIIESMLPCNIIVEPVNRIFLNAKGTAVAAGGCCSVSTFFLTNDFNETYSVPGRCTIGLGTAVTEFIAINSKS